MIQKTLFEKSFLVFQITLITVLAAILILKAYSTLHWRMENDTPVLLYASFLMNKYGFIPYRDIVETSMPGTFAFYYLMGKFFGYSDLAFRYVDLTLLGILLAATYKFMHRFGNLAAMWSTILFGLIYLSYGQQMSLQRDYIGIFPVVFALLAIPARIDTPVHIWRFIYIGFMFGLSVLIKPHLGIAFPIVFGMLLVYRWNSKLKSMPDFIICALSSGLSLLLPILVAFIWLAINSALRPFLDIVIHFLPLYNHMTGDYEVLPWSSFIFYLIDLTSHFGHLGILFLCALFAYYYLLINTKEDRVSVTSCICLLLCSLSYMVYTTIAGKFWPYHYMPFAYFCTISTGLFFAKNVKDDKQGYMFKTKATIRAMALIVTVLVQLPLIDYLYILNGELHAKPEVLAKAYAPKRGRVDEIAGWLKNRLQPGDTVLPLDVTGGSVHAMLLSEAKLATKFITDYPFYLHISSPFIQGWRRSYINELYQSPPRFIIEVDDTKEIKKPWVSGIDTTREFPELHKFMNENYSLAVNGYGYHIYEKVNPG
jgi:4-amino-4-deoxy-L-arabinose transferase-like glycosyltransferase